jgi:hypothetical protein
MTVERHYVGNLRDLAAAGGKMGATTASRNYLGRIGAMP